ncbi:MULTISPECIES: GFA family protein [unclassified Cupriavidus]|uniref:GFA family protein n=1 Tax=Cupriavidus sp. H19C3 TaxID=3241603 RepID=UPI003BF81D45
MQAQNGGCLCGAIRYTLTGVPRSAAICHCRHCQRQSGSLFSINLFVDEADFALRGETKAFEDFGDSGHPSYRHFCGNCGSPLFTRVSTMPGTVLVKAGTLDSVVDVPSPQVEIYTERAARWLAPVAGTTRFPLGPA